MEIVEAYRRQTEDSLEGEPGDVPDDADPHVRETEAA
jgi:hypothetical protein